MTMSFAPRVWAAALIALVFFAWLAWPRDTIPGIRAKPPLVETSAGGFTVRRLTAPVTIDGRNWIAAEAIIGSQAVRAPNGQFSLTLEDAKEPGDLVRFRLSYSAGGPGIPLDPHVTYAYITPDSRWIVLEPIDVIDVTNWRRYSLSKAFDVTPYVLTRAISADGRRLYVTRQPCPFDCRDLPNDHYEITFAAR
jgi:hypothetical protein